MSLPEVQPFSGRPGECFKRFVNSFDMKYPKEKWRDSNRVQLFQSFLRKNALTVFETLPREIREGTYDGVIEAMKARMRIDGNSQRVKALANLRLLALKPGQPLSEFCFALEGLANRAYPDMPPEATSLQKAEILCRQLANWEGSYCLTEALETSKCEEAYEKVKEAALRLERSLKTAEECRRLDQRRSEIRHGQLTFRRGEPIDDRSPKSSPRSDPEKASKPTIGHRPQTAPNFQKKKRENGSPRCYNCGNMGHLAKDCRDRLGRQQSTPSTVSAQQRPNAAYASLVEKWVCTSFRVPESETSELFGDKPLAGIMLCGIEATALLDTGSQTTIIPVKLLKKAIDKGIDLDEHIERIPGPNTKVRDASGNVMEFLDTIRVQVEMVSAFVGRTPDEVVILGTNALELYNLRLLKIPDTKSEQLTSSTNPSVAARVKNRTYVPSKAVGMLKLTCSRVSAVDTPLLCSSHPFIPDGICCSTDRNEVSIPVVNHSNEGLVFKKGELVGEWEDNAWIKPRYIEPDRNMLDLDRPRVASSESRNDRLMKIILDQNPIPDKAAALLKEFNDVFAVTDAELTQTDLVVHEIDTGDHKPIRQKTRPVPIAARKEFKETIKDLVGRGIVERSSSEWASPVVLVRKKDGTLRVCIDYRELNKVIRQDSYPLPKIDTVLQCLAGKKVFSTMDLASGYWQIRLSEDAKRKSAFTTSEGLFQFTVLPFGLSTSPAVFQRMMDMVLKGLELEDEVFVYIDDILVATESIERHYVVLRRVFEALRKANLRLKPQKCTFFRESVSFLGHYIDKDGVRTDPEKIRKIAEYPLPTSAAELRTFLGMASYYRKFIAARATTTRRKKRRQAKVNNVVCRATTNGDDTSPLGLFFRCPGRYGQSDDGYVYSCTIQGKTFKDVVPTASEAIGNIHFDSIFALARLISIYEHERSEERRRFLMLDSKHCSISSSGVQKAYLFYKKYCDHVFRTLTLHDGSFLCLAHDGGTGLPLEELNQATNDAVRYAKLNDWDEMVRSERIKILMILPDSFRTVNSAFKENPDIERRLYGRINDIGGLLESSTARTCILVGPTTAAPCPKRDWCKLASAMAAAARMGMKIVAVAPPRGDEAYLQNRADMNDAINLAKSAAVLMKQGLCSLIPAIESSQEPSHGPGAHPRSSTSEAYSEEVLKEYFEALRSYVKAEVDLPPLISAAKGRHSRTRQYFKQKKEAHKSVTGGVSKSNSRHKYPFFRNDHHRTHANPMMMTPPPFPILQYPPWMVQSTPTAPNRGYYSRGRGRGRRGYPQRPR
ncbi:zinc knuckle [Ostertagia ostertagi]